MDPNLKNFPILSYVIEKLPSFKRTNSTKTDHDIENQPPTPPTPHFELYEKMPHLKNPKLVSAMRNAVSDVSKTRSVIQTLGTRPDHETLDTAKSRVAEIDAREIKDSDEIDDYKVYKAAIALEEMHASYEKMLVDAERRLERIYEAAVNGDDVVVEDFIEEKSNFVVEEMNEEIVRVLKEAELGKVFERVELCGKDVRSFPEAFGKLKFVVVMNLSCNRLQVIPDSVAGLENLEELNLSSNVLESLPDSIGLLFKLKILDVSKNKLTALPDSICHCRSLVELDASFNKLTYLPTNIGFELVNLQKLSIHLNKIRSLPTSIGEMKSLCLLDVHFNELHGLPHSIGKLKNLVILNLGSNFSDLTELPQAFSDLTNLEELDLSNNQIHALPDTFGRLVNLTKLNVAENPLEIPPKEIVSEGIEAVRAFMDKRQEEMLMEEQSNNMVEAHDGAQVSLLTRSTSWLSNVVSNVSGYMGGSEKSNADDYLNQKF